MKALFTFIKQLLTIVDKVKTILVLLAILVLLLLSLKLISKIKVKEREYKFLQENFQQYVTGTASEKRQLELNIFQANQLLRVKDEALRDYSKKEKRLLMDLAHTKAELKNLQNAIGITYTNTIDTIFINKETFVRNDSCQVVYNDGYLNLSALVTDKVQLKYIYKDNINASVMKAKYHIDGTEIKHPRLYFWKNWETKVRVKLGNPNAVVDTLIYIKLK